MMSATDELRGGLRELGVQYQACGDNFTMWKHDGKTATYAEYPEGGKLKAFVTPEQAIAATVGLEPDDTAMLKLHDRMNAALLEFERAMGIEKADGAIAVPFVAEIHNLLEEAATVGRGTCKLERADWDDGMHWTWGCICTACNAHLEHETGIGYYNFCPVCGRKVIKDA